MNCFSENHDNTHQKGVGVSIRAVTRAALPDAHSSMYIAVVQREWRNLALRGSSAVQQAPFFFLEGVP
jgi:hypothetical protein